MQTDEAILTAHPEANELSMTTRRIYCELVRRGIETEIWSAKASVIAFHDPKTGVLRFTISSLSDKTSAAAVRIGDRKPATQALAGKLGIPIPEHLDISKGSYNLADLMAFVRSHGSVVVKPSDAAHGYGVTVGITDQASLELALAEAFEHSEAVIVQEEVPGDDIRIIVIGGEYVSAMKRTPAHVIGDGQHTIRELIEAENQNNPNRSGDYTTLLSDISLHAAQMYLGEKLEQVPSDSEYVRVVGPANISLGGELTNAYGIPSKAVIADAIKITDYLGLVASGVDFIIDKQGNYKFIEINPTPALYEHDDPTWGIETNAIAKYVDALLA